MLKTFTETEMLDYWKRRLGLKASPAVVGHKDYTALDKKLLDEIEIWYNDLLQNAPIDKVPVADFASDVACRRLSENTAEITIPQDAVRFVALRMEDWKCDEIETHSVYSDIARLQRNRLTRATIADPVVLERPGLLEAHGLREYDDEIDLSLQTPTIKKLEMVCRPKQGTFTLDPTLLRRSELRFH